MEQVNMIAPCGIDCSACEIRQAAQDPVLAEKLAARWRETWLPNAEAGWMKCRGCRGDRSLVWTEDCALYKCCVEDKGLTYCGDCADFPCAQLREWAATSEHHQAAFERLKQMRDQ